VAAEAAGIGRMHHVGHPAKRVVRDAVLRATPHRVWQRRAQLRLTAPELAGLPRTGVGSR
jgi:hypothetical protein